MILGLFRTEERVGAERALSDALVIYLGADFWAPGWERNCGPTVEAGSTSWCCNPQTKTFVDFPAVVRPGDLTLPVRTVQNPFKPSLRTGRLPPLLNQLCNRPK